MSILARKMENHATRLRITMEDLAHWNERGDAILAEAEATLQAMELEHSVWVTLRTHSDESIDGAWFRDFEQCLGLHRHNGESRLCYSVGEAGDPDSYSIMPVTDCSGEERRLALGGIPSLLAASVGQKQSEGAELEGMVAEAAIALMPFRTRGELPGIRNEECVEMKVRDVLKLLESNGWYLVVTRGSHRQFKHPQRPGRVTVAGKPGDEIPPGTLNSILKQAGLKP